jgi:type I site-specific restriction-modification system R (restriction) subunit
VQVEGGLMQNLTAEMIHQNLINLTILERKTTTQILDHLSEVNQRKLFLKYGCNSLLRYCVKQLKYSEGAAYRRIKALRLTAEMPELKENIKLGNLNLTQLSDAQSLFELAQREKKKVSTDDKLSILEKIRNKNKHDSQNIVREELNLPILSHKIEIPVKRETYDKWIDFKGRLVHKNLTDEMLLKYAIDKTLASIESKSHQRLQSAQPLRNEKSRYIPLRFKQELLQKADYKCTHIGCKSSFGLEIDHIVPFAKGGKTTLDNLRVLCRHHNQARNFE